MKHNKGFTLIEIMIVVVIIGILAAVAYPSYVSSVIKTNRASGKNMMLQLAQQEERYYTENNTYGILTALGYPASPVFSQNNTYSITLVVTAPTATTPASYIITGVPQVSDTTCGNLTLSNTGLWTNAQGAPASQC